MTTTTTCQTCQKEFKIIEQERHFYQSQKLPDPVFCPSCRHKQRMALRSERNLYPRICQKCDKKILSTIPESAPYIIYCHTCFWEDIG